MARSITTEIAINRLIEQGIKAKIHPHNIESMKKLRGTNPDVATIDFYKRMIEANAEILIAACKGGQMIKDDKPEKAAPVTPEERKTILDKLEPHISSDKVLTMDGEQRRGSRQNNVVSFNEYKKK